MKAITALPCFGGFRQGIALGTAIQHNFIAVIIENAFRRAQQKPFGSFAGQI
jgi:hypothetical protein